MAQMTQSLEDYIEAVYMLAAKSSAHEASVGDVARILKVTMPSVVKALHELKKLALVTQEPYCGIRLTECGRREARKILERHNLLRDFLLKLGVGVRTADRDACQMEHILSAETLRCIRIFTEKKQDEKPD